MSLSAVFSQALVTAQQPVFPATNMSQQCREDHRSYLLGPDGMRCQYKIPSLVRPDHGLQRHAQFGFLWLHLGLICMKYCLSHLIRSTPASGTQASPQQRTENSSTLPLKSPTQQTPKFVLTAMSNPLKLGPIELSHRIAMAPLTASIPLHHHSTDTPQNTTSNAPPRAVSSSAKQPKNGDGYQKGARQQTRPETRLFRDLDRTR